ncbi:MAG: hypothetical protein KC502_12100 [Myxococcales bacterium]|nr:hypothetical protein [Myxococcales bacterium]
MAADTEHPHVDDLGDLEIREHLERIERKPPKFRAFRVALYSLYLLLAGWLVVSIAIGTWQSVYGTSGDALRARPSAPLAASPAPSH